MSIYVKIDNLKYNDSECYYKEYINTNIHPATIFNENYIYYYKYDKLLGKFKGYTKVSSGSINCDIDFEAYLFENETILLHNKADLYCKGISDVELDEKMICLDTGFTYNNCLIYYKTN